MFETKVINFVAAPSIGKTLISSLVFAELKTEHKSCELVQEFAKQLIWQEKFEELNNQRYVNSEQYKKLKCLKGKVEYIITDSPLLLGIIYNKEKENSHKEQIRKMILDNIDEFNNIYIFLERNEDFPFEQNGRIHNEEQSKYIQQELKKLLDELNIKYLSVKSSKNNLKKIIDYISSF